MTIGGKIKSWRISLLFVNPQYTVRLVPLEGKLWVPDSHIGFAACRGE